MRHKIFSLRNNDATPKPNANAIRLAVGSLVMTSLLALSPHAFAQLVPTTGPDTESFGKIYGNADSSGFDSVNLENGKLNLNIPIFSYPQRGGKLSFSFSLGYQSLVFAPMRSPCDPTGGGGCVAGIPYAVSGGMYLQPSFLIDADNPYRYYGPLVDGSRYMSVDGTGHQYYPCGLANSPFPNQEVRIDNKGTVYSQPCYQSETINYSQTITDSNGNQITGNLQNEGTYGGTYPGGVYSLTGWTDTMGRTISAPNINGSAESFSWTVPGIYGGDATYTFAMGSIVPNPRSKCAIGANDCPVDGSDATFFGILNGLGSRLTSTPGTFGVQLGPGIPVGAVVNQTGQLASLSLPDGTAWSFSYDNDTGSGDHYGDLTKITLPTGGSISYTWGNFPVLNSYCQLGAGSAGWARTLTSRTTNAADGTAAQTWTYALVPVNVSGGPSTSYSVGSTDINTPGSVYGMLVTDPAGNQTLHIFQGVNGSCSYFEVDTEIYQGPVSSSDLLWSTQTTYAANPGASTTSHSPYPIFDEVWPTSVTTPVRHTIYDAYANGPALSSSVWQNGGSVAVTEQSHFGEATSMTSTDLTTSRSVSTSTTYRWQNSASYLSAGLLQLVSSTAITSGNVPLAQTNYGYDETAINSPGSVPQWVSSPPMQVRGNPTSTGRWLDTNNSFITSSTTWYGSGQMYQQLDAYQYPISTYAYSINYAGAYPTQTQVGSLPVTTATYDFNTGLPLVQTDQNGKATQISYYTSGNYQLNHVATYQSPDGGSATFTYPNANTTNVATLIDGAMSRNETSITDGLGRVTKHQVSGAPAPCAGGIISEDTTYDYANRVVEQSNPYCNMADATYSLHETDYDALGRVTYQGAYPESLHLETFFSYPNANSQLEAAVDNTSHLRTFDAAGRIVSVLEQSDQGRQGDPPSVETDYRYDSLGNLAKIDQLGDPAHSPQDPVIERQYHFDSLGRITSAFDPETGTRGVTYDSNSNVQTMTDARGIATLSCYDHLNRLLSLSTIDTSCPSWGPSSNPDQLFTYDTSVAPFAGANLQGRQSSSRSYTNNTLNSVEAYSYDAVGRLASTTESLPSDLGSGTSHATTVEYNYLGQTKQLTYPSGRQITYGWNAVNMLVSMQDSTAGGSGAQYLSGTAYYPDATMQQYGYANGFHATITRDNSSRMIGKVTSSGPTGVLSNIELDYMEGDHDYGAGMLFNVWSHINANYNVYYGYDPLNRVSYYAGPMPLTSQLQPAQTYSYTASGNIIQANGNMPAPQPPTATYGSDNKLLFSNVYCSASTSALAIDANNPRYDLAGNLLCDGDDTYGTSHKYVYDRPGRLSSILVGQQVIETYSYSAEGNRIEKRSPANGSSQEYAWSAGKVLSSRTNGGAWTDYIYGPDGGMIAETNPTVSVLHLSGTCGDCGAGNGNATVSALSSSLTGYTIQSGDRLFLRQKQHGGVRAGLYMYATDGTNSVSTLFDGAGNSINAFTDDSNSWLTRAIDLTPWSGKQISANLGLSVEGSSGSGTWDSWIADVSLVTSNGSILTLFSGQSVGGTPWIASPTTQFDIASDTDATQVVHYFERDGLGTTVEELGAGGWPIWRGTFSPFGQEVDSSYRPTSFVFTGTERDPESGNDNFGARYYSSTQARFISPDPSGQLYADLGNPQSLNLYTYVANQPLYKTDPSGLGVPTCHEPDSQGGSNDAQFISVEQGGCGDPSPPGTFDCQGGGDPSLVCLATRFWVWLTSGANTPPTAPPPNPPGDNGQDVPGGGTTPTGGHYANVSYWPTGAGGFGHIGIGVDTEQTQGFSTANPKTPVWLRVIWAPKARVELDVPQHTKNNEIAPHSYIRIPISADQANAMQAAIANRTSNSGRYNLIFNNCAQFVENVLHAGHVSGVPHGEVFGPALLGAVLWYGNTWR